ncbi:uncharacterized protein C1orf21 homolog isoform 1-T1 [Leptodactylus fuscus]|uniref:uncharacterized protein C1orf21 homolog isoform X1 n=1 Tax=Leptodactylus fuscus TaxID=238119 RepID=UPI003F4E6A46
MGCASAKHVSTVQNDEDAQNGKSYQNGDAFCDEYRIKPVEEVKYMKNGDEEEQKIVQKNQENLAIATVDEPCQIQQQYTADMNEEQEKSATHNARPRNNTEAPGPGQNHRLNIHISESQQEFFRMLDEKIEKGRDYCSEEEDIT